MTLARTDPPAREPGGPLRWFRSLSEIENAWHLAFDPHEALCGQAFSARHGSTSRTLDMGPPDGPHCATCKAEIKRRLNL